MRRIDLVAAIAVLAFNAAAVALAAEFHVAPAGSDTNPGTEAAPFATLGRAREAVRQQVRQGLDGNVTVWMAEGTYPLAEPLSFGPEDGGTEKSAVVYAARPGRKVVLSGGRRVTGWKQGEGDVWTATLPEVRDGKWQFRNLFVGDRRAVRARTPNQDAQPNCVQLKAVEFAADRSRFSLTLPPSVLGNWTSPGDMEVMVAGNWAINRKRVQGIDAGAGSVTLLPPHEHGPDYIFPAAGRWCCLENARELLDQPGEWCLEGKTGVLSYRPLADEDMATAEVVAPVASQLIVVQGTPERPVRNLHFKGLRLLHADWQLPPEGYMGIQACHYGHSDEPGRRWKRVPAAVFFGDALGCGVEDCVIAHLGGGGVELSSGCRDCLVEGNRISDAAANGVMVGGPNVEERVPKGNRVANNHVHACGREFYGAIGIWVGFAQRTSVSHNLVHDLPYSGISVGWEWNEQPTSCGANVVESNHVYDVMNRLCDGGCIYTLGLQPDTVIRGNHLHGVRRSPMAQGAPNNGMFIDQGSKGYLFERNVIYDTSAAPIRFNQCRQDWHTWRDNYIGDEAKGKEPAKEIIEQAGLQPPWKERDS